MKYNYIITCPRNVESLLAKEVKFLGYKKTNTNKGFVSFQWDLKAIAKLNLWSRVWSKLYLQVAQFEESNDFTQLFDNIQSIDWKYYISGDKPFVVNVVSKWAKLTSTPSCQKIVKKSIAKKLLNGKEWHVYEDSSQDAIEVLVVLESWSTQVLINTTWEGLFKRWYKTKNTEASLKENVAAALVILAWWKFSETFFDPFCWWGTLAIEAAMLAKNIAPGMYRNFAFEYFDWYDKNILQEEKAKAKDKIFHKKSYKIIASDIDSEILEIAKDNAKNAWVFDDISFIKKDFLKTDIQDYDWTLLCNPPYWIRLQSKDIKRIHDKLLYILSKNNKLWWAFYTAYEWFDFDKSIFKKRLIYNWAKEAYLYKKK